MVSALPTVSPEEVRVGLAVEVGFERVAEDLWLPVFHPASSS